MDGGALEAAQAALAQGDAATAVARLQEAIAAGPNPAAHQLLGALLFMDDDLAGARREWEQAFREWKDAGEPRAAALVATGLADLHASGLGNEVVGHAWVERARRLLDTVERCVEQGYVDLAMLACDVEDVVQLERTADAVRELAEEFGDTDLGVRALADGGYARVVQGRTDEGFALLDEAMAALAAGEVQNPATAGRSYCALLSACDRVGDVARAEAWTRVIAERYTEPLGQRPRVMHTHCRVARGSVLCISGQLTEGEAALLEALGPGSSAYFTHRVNASARLASLRLLQGRLDEAAALLAPYEDRLPACESLARLHLVSGELDLAEAVARRGLDGAGGDLLRVGAMRALLVEIALARDDVERAETHAAALDELATAADSRILRMDAWLARARVEAARPDPSAALAAYDEVQALLLPDERPVLAGTVALEQAEALAGTGDRGGALDRARTAIATFDRLGALPLVDRADALLRSLGSRARAVVRQPSASVAGLTAREQQVLELVRQGLTNAEIGERLFISAKTAEHHVGRVLAKLGVRTRAEAAAVATAASLQR